MTPKRLTGVAMVFVCYRVDGMGKFAAGPYPDDGPADGHAADIRDYEGVDGVFKSETVPDGYTALV